jgi:6 kDa early secretory antigenic target
MNDELLVVNFAALDAASSDIAHALGELTSQLDQLERDAAPLVAQWAGEARAAYDTRQTRWRSAANDLSGMLHDSENAVDASAEDYVATERSNARLFG